MSDSMDMKFDFDPAQLPEYLATAQNLIRSLRGISFFLPVAYRDKLIVVLDWADSFLTAVEPYAAEPWVALLLARILSLVSDPPALKAHLEGMAK